MNTSADSLAKAEYPVATILVVDDDTFSLTIILESLKSSGLRILVALNGESAIDKALHSLPDLILLDIMMPGIDGFETCRRLKTNEALKSIPVIFMTALTDPADKMRGFQAGGVDYVTKPIQVEELLARVRTHIALRMMHKQLEARNAQLQEEIIKHKQAEDARRESEARLRAFIDNLPFEFWAMDGSLTYTMQNATSLKNYGNVVGKRIDELGLPSEVASSWIEQDRQVLNGKILHEEYEREAKGSKQTFENIVAPVAIDEAVVGIVGVAIDVTERKHTEEALQVSEERFRIVSELTSDFAYAMTLNPDGIYTIEWLTNAFTRITGYLPAEIQAPNSWRNLFHPDDLSAIIRHFQEHSTDQSIISEFRIITKNGEVRWLRNFARLEWNEITGIIVHIYGAARDITKQKQMEQQMLRSERLAAMGHITATLAHEVNNPLQAFQGNIDLLLDFPLSPDERQQCLLACRYEVSRLIEITQSALSFTRDSQEKYQLVSIPQVWQQTLFFLKNVLEKSTVHLTTVLPDDLPAVMGSANQLGQVLFNLVLNAIESMPGGGKINLSGYTRQEQLVLVLANNGPHIPAEHLERIFEPFFTTKPSGTGLGLFVVQNIIHQHGGTLEAENLKGEQGVAFTIVLPLAKKKDPLP